MTRSAKQLPQTYATSGDIAALEEKIGLLSDRVLAIEKPVVVEPDPLAEHRELKAKAKELELDTSGTTAEIRQRIADAEE